MNEEFDLEERTRQKVEEAANSIKLQWDSPALDGKFLLLVEHRNDRLCYYKLFNSAKVEIRTNMGCNSMRHLFEAVQATGVPNFAIQDSDFARVCGRVPKEANYFLTDRHDHEMMCLEMVDIMRALFENQATAYDSMLVDAILDDLNMVSWFKWFNYQHRLDVNFKGYSTRGKSRADLRSFSSIHAEVMPMSPHCTATILETDVVSFVNSQSSQDRFEITNGHDFLNLLTEGIGRLTGNHNLRVDDLRTTMYASFTMERFRVTQLYQSIYAWAGSSAEMLFAA